MRVHSLQHVPFEGLGTIEPWLASRAAQISVTRLYDDPQFPDLGDIDGLIVMGGPMSVNDERRHAWLASEKRFIERAIAAGKRVLGVCLGAQLIAAALGARVYANPEREIGWFPVQPTPTPTRPESPFAPLFSAPVDVFHWHGETFDLPAGATHLARNDACEHQAFAIGERVLGLQFHLEATVAGARAMIENCPADLAPGRWVQSARQMLENAGAYQRANRVMDTALGLLMAMTLEKTRHG